MRSAVSSLVLKTALTDLDQSHCSLRENFSAKGRWNSAITKVRAANSFKTAGLENRERRSRQSSIREGSDASSAVGQYNDTDDEEGYATADEESAPSPKKKSGETKGGGL